MDESSYLILGANGQLGTALREKYPLARTADVSELDITNVESLANYNWSNVKVILNAAAYTNVDGAETEDGRKVAWEVNASAVARLAHVAQTYDITLVHISTEYVFDGTVDPHVEAEPFSPISSYGTSKAAGDIAASFAPKHYIVRTSWVMGSGKNFVRTMIDIVKKGISPKVVSDQTGRPTFTIELVRAIDHLLKSQVAYGVYNLSNDGDVVSWADLTREVFKIANFKLGVTDITAEEYSAGKENVAKRPAHSALDLSKIHETSFTSHNWRDDLKDYVEKELQG